MRLGTRSGPVLRRLGVVFGCAALCACTPRPPPAPTPTPVRQTAAPQCRLEGCCHDHGEVAYIQRDLMVICTDGTASTICDCHM